MSEPPASGIGEHLVGETADQPNNDHCITFPDRRNANKIRFIRRICG
jgi:hypothetical protein